MEIKEITDAIENASKGLKEGVEGAKGQAAEALKKAGELITSMEAKADKSAVEGLVKQLTDSKAELQGQFDALSTKVNKGEMKNEGQKSFSTAFSESVKENFEEVSKVTKGRSKSFEIKAVGNMTVASNLTGESVHTYQPGVAAVPTQKVNLTDLIPQVSSATGTYIVYRETGAEGAIANQGTAGASKSQKDYDFTAVTFTADYLAGFTRYAKQMAQDLPFLQSSLPQILTRDFYKAENASYWTSLSTAATASTTAKTVDVEQLIDDLAALETLDYTPNGILLSPKDWANIAVTKPSDYSLPGIVQFAGGRLSINGVPVYKASFVPADKYMVGDFSMAKNVVVDGLKVEFFEQDGDNVTKNLITSRIERRECLAIDRPDAFIYGDFGNVA